MPLAAANASAGCALTNVSGQLPTGLAKRSYTLALTATVATLLATRLLGEMVNSDTAALGVPATNVTVAVSLAAPAVAVMVFASALLVRTDEVTTPLLSVDPLALLKISLAFELVKVTACPDTTLA